MKSPRPPRTHHSAFTLIELLIVITIVAILVAVAIPVFSAIKQKANASRSTANLRVIGEALAAYQGDHDNKYPALYSDQVKVPQLDNLVSELVVAMNTDATMEELEQAPPTKVFVSPGISWEGPSGRYDLEDLHSTYAGTDALVGFDYEGKPDPTRGRHTSRMEKRPETILMVEAEQEGTERSCVPHIDWALAEGDLEGDPEETQAVDFRYRKRLSVLKADYSAASLSTEEAAEIEQWNWQGYDYPPGY